MSKKEQQIKEIIKNKKIKTFGVEIPLTPEQLKEFEKMVEPKYRNPYERVEKGKEYFTIKTDDYEGISNIWECFEDGISTDESRFKNGNYYDNRCFAEQIAMELNLQQKLRKFTYNNGWNEELWGDDNVEKFYVYFYTSHRASSSRFKISSFKTCNTGQVYYASKEIAQRAIDEIIIPFMKENPTFKW